MRTLKKTLCLVLALVMVLGLCVVTASADLDYTDVASITKNKDNTPSKFDEAIDVLSGLGILKGYPDGSFQPGRNVTRAEAAKIVTYIMIGDAERADAMTTAKDPFTDVPASHWAAGYIAYNVERGVINGVGDGNFRPNDPVTNLEFAKMMLCALGYGVNGEYTGASWDINTAKDAVQYGIFDYNLDGVNTNPARREEVALYAFNTLWLEKVTYAALYGGYIQNSQSVWNADSNKEYKFAYDFGLGKALDESDAFARPQGYYYFVSNAAGRQTPISNHYNVYGESGFKQFFTPVSGSMIYDFLGAARVKELKDYLTGSFNPTGNVVINPGSFNPGTLIGGAASTGTTITSTTQIRVFENGVQRTGIGMTSLDLLNNLIFKGNPVGLAGTGYGVETDVYNYDLYEVVGYDPYNYKPVYAWRHYVDICIIHTYLGQVSSVKAATAMKNAYVNVTFPQGYDTYNTDPTFNDKTFETEKFGKGDYVLFTYSFKQGYDRIIDMNAAQILNSKITSYTNVTSAGAQIGANGSKYFVAEDDYVITAKQTRGSVINHAFVNGTTYSIFMDLHDNVIGVDATANNKKFVYVTQFGFKTTSKPSDVMESLALTVQFVDGEGATQVRFLSMDSTLVGSNQFTVHGNTFNTLADAWAEAEWNHGETQIVAQLNSLTEDYAGSVYAYGLDADGNVKLTDLETLANYTAKNDPTLTETETYGENKSNNANLVLYRGVALMAEDQKGVKGIDANISRNYNLFANTDTVLFFVNNANTRNPANVKVYKGISDIPYVDYTGSNNSIYQLYSWYGEADYTDFVDKNTGRDNTPAGFQSRAFAQTGLVRFTGKAAPVADGPVYLYVNENIFANWTGKNGGAYTKIDNGDGTYTVEFYAFPAGADEFKTLSFQYDNEFDADSAIETAEEYVRTGKNDFEAAWILEGDNGLVLFNPDSNLIEKYSNTDKTTYATLATTKNQFEMVWTGNGATIFYKTTSDSSSKLHNRGIELTDDELVFDLRADDNRIDFWQFDDIDSVAALEEAINQDGRAFNLMIAFGTDFVVKGIYIMKEINPVA